MSVKYTERRSSFVCVGVSINYSHVDPPTGKLVQGLASAGDDSPFFPSVSHIIDYAHFSTTEFWNQKKDLRSRSDTVAGAHRPPVWC